MPDKPASDNIQKAIDDLISSIDPSTTVQPADDNSSGGIFPFGIPEIPVGTPKTEAPKPQEIATLQPETTPIKPEAVINVEKDKPLETMSAPDNAQIQDQKNKEVVPSGQPEPTQPIQPNVVDLRTHHKKIHRVSPNADSITSIADLKEQDFIEGVEKAHEHSN